MRVFTADFIVPITQEPIKNGFLVTDNAGVIVGVYANLPGSFQSYKVEKYGGIICPGFVNTHCHLELSHLKNQIPEKTGLAGFIDKVQQVRDLDKAAIESAMLLADAEMYKNGIVAVGDICNSINSLAVKQQSNIHYHNFIELFGLSNETEKIDFGLKLVEQFKKVNSSSLTPHANYSVSDTLLKGINNQKHTFLTIHNQESTAENEFFENKKGLIYNQLIKFGVDLSNWQHPKKSALQYILPKLNKSAKIQLVHNTYTSEKDIAFAENHSNSIFWCFCPNANLYIENKLPNIPAFLDKKCKIVLGTDSLASNKQLSILEELKSIQLHFPTISVFEILKWATINGAMFLEIDSIYGSFDKNKKPGVINISNLDTSNSGITSKTNISRLL